MTKNKSKIGVCPLCGEEKELILSHIIPKFCYRRLKNTDESGNLWLLLDKTTKVQDEFREYLLCHECDNKFSKAENKFKRTLDNIDKHRGPYFNFGEYKSSLVKYDKDIKTTLVFILYKAHISSKYKNFSLGNKFHKIAKDFLLDEINDNNEVFPFMIGEYNGQKEQEYLTKAICFPKLKKVYQINFIELILYGYQFLIKVDSRPPKYFRELYNTNHICISELPVDDLAKHFNEKIALQKKIAKRSRVNA